MGTILPDAQAHEMQVVNYNPNDLRNQPETKVVTQGPGGILVTQDRVQISDPGTPQQQAERGHEAAVTVDVQSHQPRMDYPDEELAEKADLASMLTAFLPDTVEQTEAQEEGLDLSTEITEDEFSGILERPPREEGRL